MRIALPALCGLVFLSTGFAAPARAQDLHINPTEAVLKATSPNAAQKKRLDALAEATQKKGQAALEAVGPMMEKRIDAMTKSEDFIAKVAATEKLSEAEQKTEMGKLTSGMIAEIRPEMEKTMFQKMRGILVEYFASAARLMKPAQKPKLEKARIAYFKNFDKEIPGAIKSMVDSAVKGE